jgi:hypothetical protein
VNPADLLPFPLSERIARGLARLEARLPDRFSPCGTAPRIDVQLREITPEPRPIERVDGDPGHMLRLKVTGEPRAVERPSATDDALAEATPQFVLRNTWRAEAEADTERLFEYRYQTVRELTHWDDVRAAHHCELERPELLGEFTTRKIAQWVAERRVVMVETPWHELYGRPEPLVPAGDR